MQEQLISFETAKLAKEKRFGQNEDDYIKLTTVYELNGELFNNGKFKITANFSNTTTPYGQYSLSDISTSIFEMDNSLDDYILAPTQSLLQKWLREKHNLHITITCIRCHLTPTDIIGYQYEIEGDSFVDNDNTYAVYEQALEAGLLEGLKLIKIEKE